MTSPDSQCRPTRSARTGPASQRPRGSGAKRCRQGVLQAVTHAAVHGDMHPPGVLAGHHPVRVRPEPGRSSTGPARPGSRSRRRGDGARPRSARGGVIADAGRGVAGLVADAQPAAEVVTPNSPSRARAATSASNWARSRICEPMWACRPRRSVIGSAASRATASGTCAAGIPELRRRPPARGQGRVGGRSRYRAGARQPGPARPPAGRSGRCRRARPRRCSRSGASQRGTDGGVPDFFGVAVHHHLLPGQRPAASAIRSSPAPTTSQPRPSSTRTRITEADGMPGRGADAGCPGGGWRTPPRYSRARARRAVLVQDIHQRSVLAGPGRAARRRRSAGHRRR